METIAYRLPNGSLKNRLKCYYYNSFMECNFKASYNENYFQFEFENGITFKCNDSILHHITSPLKNYLAEYKLCRNDVVIDCGAYVGAFTLYAANAVGDAGLVVAFEPDPLNYSKLVSNIKLNNLKNVIAIEKGVWSKNKILKFRLHPEMSS